MVRQVPMVGRDDTRRSKVVHRQTFQNSNHVVELTLKTIPKCGLFDPPPASIAPRPYVRDCLAKRELQELERERNNNNDVKGKGVVRVQSHASTSKTRGSKVSVEVRRRKASQQRHEHVPLDATWESVLRECSTIGSEKEDEPDSSSSASTSSSSVSLSSRKGCPPVAPRPADAPKTAAEGQDIRVTPNAYPSSNPSSVPPHHGRAPDKGRLPSEDVTSSPFSDSALNLLRQLREILQARGQEEGSALVGVLEAFISGQGSGGGVGAAQTLPTTLKPTPSPPHQHPHTTPTAPLPNQQQDQLPSAVTVPSSTPQPSSATSSTGTSLPAASLGTHHEALLRDLERQRRVIADQERVIQDLKTLGSRLIIQQDEIAENERRRKEANAASVSTLPQGPGASGEEDRAPQRERSSMEAHQESEEEGIRVRVDQLTAENEKLQQEVNSLRELVVNLEIQLTKAHYLLEKGRQSPSCLSSSKLSSSAPNLNPGSRRGPTTQPGPSESEADSAYEERSGSFLTSKMTSPHSDGVVGQGLEAQRESEAQRVREVQKLRDDADRMKAATQRDAAERTKGEVQRDGGDLERMLQGQREWSNVGEVQGGRNRDKGNMRQVNDSKTQRERTNLKRMQGGGQRKTGDANKLKDGDSLQMSDVAQREVGNDLPAPCKTQQERQDTQTTEQRDGSNQPRGSQPETERESQKCPESSTAGRTNSATRPQVKSLDDLGAMGLKVSDLELRPWVPREEQGFSSFSTLDEHHRAGETSLETSFLTGMKGPRLMSTLPTPRPTASVLESTRLQEGSLGPSDIGDDTGFAPVRLATLSGNMSLQCVEELE